MPTQMEVDYWRNRYQRMNKERFAFANIMALVSHTITQPLDLIKVRAQMLQEGKTFNGLSFQRGDSLERIFEEIHASGGGVRRFYTCIDAFLLRTFTYTTARTWSFLYVYDKVNKDPRRVARPDYYIFAGMTGGFVAGVLTNPFELVFTRMQVDDLYPAAARRNYKNVVDGLIKVYEEGALLRGATANGLKVGILCSSMTSLYDWMKEWSYFFLGPMWYNRFTATSLAVGAGVAATMPIDMIRVRLHTMRSLPNGELPYKGILDTWTKIHKYECNQHKQANLQSFYAGAYAYYGRLFGIAYLSMWMLDYYYKYERVPEYWVPAKFGVPTNIDLDIHDPWTMAYHKMVTQYYREPKEFSQAYHPTGKDPWVTI